MSTHHVTGNASFFYSGNASNGDNFILTGKGAGMTDFGLSNTTIAFMGNNESATFLSTGPTTIHDEGQGTHMTFMAGDGVVTIYDFQHDHSGFIRGMQTATATDPLTVSSDHHGGSWLTGSGLSIHLVGDAHVTAAQHT